MTRIADVKSFVIWADDLAENIAQAVMLRALCVFAVNLSEVTAKSKVSQS